MSHQISIIIPVYNEEKNIYFLVEELFNYLENTIYEVIIVNDKSSDNTKEVLSNISKKFKCIKIINNELNFGQSFSIKIGIDNSKYDTIITIDGDCQNNPKDIPMMIEEYFLDDKLELLGGIRKNRKDSLNKIISSKIANFIRAFILNDDCIDTGCSLKIFSKKTFLLFPFFDGIHRFLPALFKGHGKKTKFVNVDHRKRKYGKSSYGTFVRLIKGVRDMIRVFFIIRNLK